MNLCCVLVLFIFVQFFGRSKVLGQDLKTVCTFEDPNICGWTQDQKGDDMDWIRHQGVPKTYETGPSTDHTYQNISDQGYYMYMEASERKPGHKAILISPEFLPSKTEVCFEFWYHMLSPKKVKKMGILEVFVLQDGHDIDHEDPLFRVEGNQGDMWHHGNVVIEVNYYFNIIIIATRGSHFKGDIAIDDVRLYNCSNGEKSGKTTISQLINDKPTSTLPETDTSDNPISDRFTEQSRSHGNVTSNGSGEPRLAEDKARDLSLEVLVPWQIVCLMLGLFLLIVVVGLLILFKRRKLMKSDTPCEL